MFLSVVIHSNRKVPVDFQPRANSTGLSFSGKWNPSQSHPRFCFIHLLMDCCWNSSVQPSNPGGVDACMNGAAGYILTLGVVDAARGHGLAKQLLQKTMDSIRQQLGPKLKAIWVHVVEYNAPATWLIQSRGKTHWAMVDLENHMFFFFSFFLFKEMCEVHWSTMWLFRRVELETTN